MGTRDQTQVIRLGFEDPLPPEPTVFTFSVDHLLDVVWKGYALQMWLCVLVLLFLFVWHFGSSRRSCLLALLLEAGEQFFPGGEGPTAAALCCPPCLWKQSQKTFWVLPFPFPFPFPSLRAEVCLSVCRRRDEKSSDTENVFCAVKVELLFRASEPSLGEETEIVQTNHFTGGTGETRFSLASQQGSSSCEKLGFQVCYYHTESTAC